MNGKQFLEDGVALIFFLSEFKDRTAVTIDNLKGDELAKFREAAETADRNYQLGAVPLTIYVETQKQYLELVGTLAELQKDALQAAQELEILTGFKLYGEETQR